MDIQGLIETMDYGKAPEDDSAARAWLERHAEGFGHFIDGAFTAPGETFETFETVDPARGTPLARVTQGTEVDVAQAVASARKAQPKWAALSPDQRARHLYALARHVQQHSRLLAVLETLDTGKPIRESRDADIPQVIRHFYHHAGWAAVLADEFPGAAPHGVCGQIIPWNFPLLMLAWKVAPALAAGNTVVLKPAEYTPLTALAFAEIAVQAGLPKGVLNIVTGDGATGAALVAAEVDKLAFTGSTEVGREIRRATAGRDVPLTLELGGKSPFIVTPEADLDAAVEGVVNAIWFNAGQVCCAGSRILVAEPVAERFEALLRARMETIRVGDPLDKSTDIGAIVHPVQLERITALVAQGAAEGAQIHQGAAPEGCFYPPTLVTDVAPANTLCAQEIFGPVVTLSTYRTPGEAVQLANNTRYGLAASIWSENVSEAMDIAAGVKAGVVWVNTTNAFDASAAFGGMRESGFGREGGREGMRAYLRTASGKGAAKAPALPDPLPGAATGGAIDRTVKFYIGGKQARPDGGHVIPVPGGLAGLGSRKDIRNAVEAAHKAKGWGAKTGHARAQVLYFFAENMAARAEELAARLTEMGLSKKAAAQEIEASLARVFWYAAQADKFDGAVKQPGAKQVALAMNEPFGVMGIACPDAHPLLGFLSMVLPPVAMGNAVVAVPSQSAPLAALELVQVMETSDIPAGVINIVSGERDALAKVLAQHDDVAALWYAGTAEGTGLVERESAGNLKPVWAVDEARMDWAGAQGRGWLERATQVKTIWVPYGV